MLLTLRDGGWSGIGDKHLRAPGSGILSTTRTR